MDFYVVCIPITIVSSLQMTLRRKITVLSVLAFGLVSISVTIARVIVLMPVTLMTKDISTVFGKVVFVSSFEVQCAVFAVNLPALKSLWTRYKERTGFTDQGVASQRSRQLPSGINGSLSRTRRKAAISSTKRLQRGLESNESEEGLFQQRESQKEIRMDEARDSLFSTRIDRKTRASEDNQVQLE
jgi:hypothetical protein